MMKKKRFSNGAFLSGIIMSIFIIFFIAKSELSLGVSDKIIPLGFKLITTIGLIASLVLIKNGAAGIMVKRIGIQRAGAFIKVEMQTYTDENGNRTYYYYVYFRCEDEKGNNIIVTDSLDYKEYDRLSKDKPNTVPILYLDGKAIFDHKKYKG